jgi:flagellar hook-length control protein FliK
MEEHMPTTHVEGQVRVTVAQTPQPEHPVRQTATPAPRSAHDAQLAAQQVTQAWAAALAGDEAQPSVASSDPEAVTPQTTPFVTVMHNGKASEESALVMPQAKTADVDARTGASMATAPRPAGHEPPMAQPAVAQSRPMPDAPAEMTSTTDRGDALSSFSTLSTEAAQRPTETQARLVETRDVQAWKVIEQLATAARFHVHGHSRELSVRLDPPELGTVHVRVVVQADGQVVAQIQTASPAVREMLDGRLAELQQALNQAGLTIEGCSVSLNSHGNPSTGQREGESFNQPAWTGQAAGRTQQQGEEAFASEPPATVRQHLGLVDYLA